MLNGKKRCQCVKINLLRSAAALMLLPVFSLVGKAQGERQSVSSLPGVGETVEVEQSDPRATNEIGIWGGGSLFVRSRRTDRSDDARLFIVGLSFARAIVIRRSFALSYTADLFPLLVLSHPRAKRDQSESASGSGPLRRMSVRATGLAPVGIRINFRPGTRTQPFLDLKFGFAFFDEKIPTDRGTNFNFTAQSGGGVQLRTGSRTSVTFGSRFHHISNAGRGLTNPGFNTVMLYTAFSIRK